MKKQHLLFDLDRTLWDFEENSKNALSILYHQYGLDNHTEHFIQFHETYKKINRKLWEKYSKRKITKEELRTSRFTQTLEKLGINAPEIATKLGEDYIEISPNQTQLFPNTLEILTELKNLGYSMNIVTNGFAEAQFRKLENCKLTPFFDHVICSETVGFSKPDRRVYNFALEKANAKKEDTVMIGDDLRADVLGAEAAGITGILFDEDTKRRYSKSITRISDLKELPLLLLSI